MTHLIQIGMHQRNIIVAGNYIAQRGQSLFYTLHLDLIRQTVSQVL